MMLPMSEATASVPTHRIQFAGPVQCDVRAAGRLRLRGMMDPSGSDIGIVDIDLTRDVFELPLTLHDAVLDRAPESSDAWCLRAGQRSWDLSGSRVHLHRDISSRAARLITPRAVPLSKRLFWSALLTVLRFEAGRRWVQRRYSA